MDIYELNNNCDICNTDPSDPTEYYEDCVDCYYRDSDEALLWFNNDTHRLQFSGYFGNDFSEAKFYQYHEDHINHGGGHSTTYYGSMYLSTIYGIKNGD
jgi:hypothetical protein